MLLGPATTRRHLTAIDVYEYTEIIRLEREALALFDLRHYRSRLIHPQARERWGRPVIAQTPSEIEKLLLHVLRGVIRDEVVEKGIAITGKAAEGHCEAFAQQGGH